jgi:hypothetical protein
LKRLGSDVGNIERKPSIGAKVATDAQNLSAATFNLPGNRRSSIGLGLGLG